VNDYLRDAALAACCAVVLLGVLSVGDWAWTLADPVAAVVGVAGALAVEVLFVANTPAAALWEHLYFRTASVFALLFGAVAAAYLVGPVLVGAAVWGLATYFVLLGFALAGVWP
jgi:hypothetical protein